MVGHHLTPGQWKVMVQDAAGHEVDKGIFDAVAGWKFWSAGKWRAQFKYVFGFKIHPQEILRNWWARSRRFVRVPTKPSTSPTSLDWTASRARWFTASWLQKVMGKIPMDTCSFGNGKWTGVPHITSSDLHHSMDPWSGNYYKNNEPFKNKDCVVVGLGESGADIVREISEAGRCGVQYALW